MTCGESDPVVLDYHHTSGEKDMNIGNMISSFPMGRILDEIAKCEVLCANCHRRWHHNNRAVGQR